LIAKRLRRISGILRMAHTYPERPGVLCHPPLWRECFGDSSLVAIGLITRKEQGGSSEAAEISDFGGRFDRADIDSSDFNIALLPMRQ
jgi:hypothetical protein